MIRVRVPASSANLGPGFDCIGIALKWYNYIEAEILQKGLVIELDTRTVGVLPCDERNLVYRSMIRVFEKAGYHPSGIRLKLTSNVPISRGIGSSAMCISGGMFAANCLLPKPFPMDTIINMASIAEGHPDNITPCLAGGLSVAVLDNGVVHYVRHSLPENLQIAMFVPNFTLSTKLSRRKLPRHISHSDGVFNLGHTALLVASLITGKYENLNFATKDRLHQFYRSNMVPDMYRIFDKSISFGARGVYLSGSGPSIAAIVDSDPREYKDKMQDFFKSQKRQWTVEILSIDNQGTVLV